MRFPKGCHAVACGIDFADEPVLKIRQPAELGSVILAIRNVTNGKVKMVAVRPRGTCKWSLYFLWREKPIMKHHELDVIRMRAALEGWDE